MRRFEDWIKVKADYFSNHEVEKADAMAWAWNAALEAVAQAIENGEAVTPDSIRLSGNAFDERLRVVFGGRSYRQQEIIDSK